MHACENPWHLVDWCRHDESKDLLNGEKMYTNDLYTFHHLTVAEESFQCMQGTTYLNYQDPFLYEQI